MKTDLCQSCGHCWIFQIYWHVEYGTLTAWSFRILNSSGGIPSPPLALILVMLPKAHLISHSRMSGYRWMITPSWFSGSWRCFFVYFFCVFLPSLINTFYVCYVHTISVLYCAIFEWNIPLVSLIFLKRSLVFPILFYPLFLCIDHRGRLSYVSLIFIGTLHSDVYRKWKWSS